MKTKFKPYYRPTNEESDKLFEQAYLVFDTNALLDLLRLSPEIANKTIGIIESYKPRVKIPHQVAIEFHNNVIEVSAEMYSMASERMDNFKFDDFENLFKDISKNSNNRFPKDRLETYKARFKECFNEVQNNMKTLTEYYKMSFCEQGIQCRLSDLLGDCVMNGLEDKVIQDIETNEGPDRYSKSIPPGYRDNGKNENKYGDLIIWKEILGLAHQEKRSIIFISNDLKEDWIYKPKGKTWGPRIELLKEFDKKCPNSLFTIYTLSQFLKTINNDNELEDNELVIIEEVNQPQDVVYKQKIVGNDNIKKQSCENIGDAKKSQGPDESDLPNKIVGSIKA